MGKGRRTTSSRQSNTNLKKEVLMLLRYRITPQAPLITPLMSDTIFGHLCWFIRYQDGEAALEDFLAGYVGTTPAPVLFSSAFPAGYLPRPTVPPMEREKAREFTRQYFGMDKVSLFEGLSRIKSWNKRTFITLDQWQALKDGYSEEGLYKMLYKEENTEDAGNHEVVELTSHNVISRRKGTVSSEGGGLFTREKRWFGEGMKLDLYTRIANGTLTTMVDSFLIEYLVATGFGADKSLGMGSLDISHDEKFDPAVFDAALPNGQMALSLTAFPGMGNYRAFYRLKTKFGKLGGDFAVSSPTGGDTKPFKKPVLMYEAGAVFMGTEAMDTVPLLSDVHSDRRIRHCGVPLTIPFTLKRG